MNKNTQEVSQEDPKKKRELATGLINPDGFQVYPVKDIRSARYIGSKWAEMNKNDNEDNKYDLTVKSVTAGPYIPLMEKDYDQNEINNFLIDYFEVPRDKWVIMPLCGWFRYIDTNGKFNIGGCIKKITSDSITMGQSGVDAYKNVFFKDIVKLYKRYAYGANIEITMLVNSVKDLSTAIKKQKARIDELERIVYKGRDAV
jgi:hypothetical protein